MQVKIRIWDKEFLGKDFLGETLISPSAMKQKEEDKWFYLRERPLRRNEQVAGEIRLQIKWVGT